MIKENACGAINAIIGTIIPAAAPVTACQDVNGIVQVQRDKGLIPAEVKSDNRSFNTDALAGGMFAGHAL